MGCFSAKHFSEKTCALNDLWLRALGVRVSLCAFVCLGMAACVLTGVFAALLHHEHKHSELEEHRLLLETKMQTVLTGLA